MPTPEEIKAEKLTHVPGVLRNNHIFCSVCGKNMVVSKNIKLGLYDKKTGVKAADTDLYVWHCPEPNHDRVEI